MAQENAPYVVSRLAWGKFSLRKDRYMQKTSIGGEWYQLSRVDFLLLEQLHYYERTFGKIFPAQKTLALRMHCSVRTVRRAVAHLKSLGLLAVRGMKYRDRLGRIRSRSNTYKILSLIGAKVRSLLTRLTVRPR